jgi:hypothetical protein
MGNLKVVLDGKGPVTVSDNDHMATGGEGTVYSVGGVVLKVYHDPKRAMWNGVGDKIDFFRKYPNNLVVAPLGYAYDTKNQVIGFYMNMAKGDPLVKLFTNDFRRDKRFSDKDSAELSRNIWDVVAYAHSHNAIMLDANELGYMVDGIVPYVLDVDSWIRYKKFPPTVAIMPSIRDWHAKNYDELSDWFSWGVVTFQIFTNIHPYKGTLPGYTNREMDRRMKDNASVFSSDIRLNHNVKDFSCIPGPLRDWYHDEFQNGGRSVPPSPSATGLSVGGYGVVMYAKVAATGKLAIERLLTVDNASRVISVGLLLLDNGNLVDIVTGRVVMSGCTPETAVVKFSAGWIVHTGDKFYFVDLAERVELRTQMGSARVVTNGNRMFVVVGSKFTELFIADLGNRKILGMGTSWSIMPHSTTWFDGFGVMDVLGKVHVVVPFGEKSLATLRVPELDGIQPINGTCGPGFLSVVGMNRAGDYVRVDVLISENYTSCSASSVSVDVPELNMTVLPKGVGAVIVKDGELTIFVPTNGNQKIVSDGTISGMVLYRWDNTVLGIMDGKLWKVTMK